MSKERVIVQKTLYVCPLFLLVLLLYPFYNKDKWIPGKLTAYTLNGYVPGTPFSLQHYGIH